jgi:hypothetical protein
VTTLAHAERNRKKKSIKEVASCLTSLFESKNLILLLWKHIQSFCTMKYFSIHATFKHIHHTPLYPYGIKKNWTDLRYDLSQDIGTKCLSYKTLIMLIRENLRTVVASNGIFLTTSDSCTCEAENRKSQPVA